LTLWTGLIGGPWFVILAAITPGSAYGTLAASCLLIALISARQLATGKHRPGTIAVTAAALMALHLPFFPEADSVAQTIPFGVAAIGAIASPFVKGRAFPGYAAYMGAIYMSQLYWQPIRTNSILSLSFEVALFTLVSVSLRYVSRSSAESNLRYRHLFERVPTSIWLEDFTEVGEFLYRWRHQGVTDLPAFLEANPAEFDAAIAAIRVTDVNPATVRLVNAKDRKSMLGSLDPRTITEDTKASFMAILTALFNEADTARTEVKGTKIDGRPLDGVLRLLAPRDSAGRLNLAEVVVSITDVTDLKRTQRLLEQAKDRAEAATATKSQFLANMSHEIRTPMNAILGMTELTLATDLTVEQREYLGITKTSVDSLLNLVNDILDFSKIEAGRLQLDSVPFSISDTIGDTVRTLAVRAKERNLSVSHELIGDVPEGLQGDPGRLRQVLINVIGNALKFTHVGGVEVNVSAEREGDEAILHFSIADSGIGIPADQLDTIFDTFAQADGSSTRRYGGTGLGLPISAQLVEMMDGQIWVESEVGVGTTVHFTARFGVVSDTASVAPVDLGRTAVLIIAGPERQRALSTMLRQGGMRPMIAASAEDALDSLDGMAEGHRPQAIVVEATSEYDLPSRLIDTNIPLLVIVEPGRRGDAGRYRNIGVAAYLTTPVANADLLDAIRTAVAGTSAGALITRHWLREHRLRFNILLADDSATNRMLAVRLLEGRGHIVTAVDDGRQAVDAIRSTPYDVVLMDVQMPIMDGLEATEAIRALEEASGDHTPIIALTAHALDSDRQRCLDAGMDAYVSKPFRASELLATIEQLASPNGKTPDTLIDPADYDEFGPAIDRRQLMLVVGGMPDLAAELASLVMEEVPEIAEKIPAALAAGDLGAVAGFAHKIKGSVGTVAAARAIEAANDLEQAARDDDASAAALGWDDLGRELKFLYAELDSLVAERVG
jgi:signal transduction histidine kinase/CheY-like chemotaxis protein/HPt (histidine-containing phosphotransfer) domain-containing protein